jgi:drug/metabolite transporter (DMT)-like permease
MTTIAETPAPDRTLEGIGWMLLTTVLFVCVTGIVRYLGSDIPAVEAAFIRYAIGLALVLPALLPLVRQWPRAALMKVFIARGIVHGIAVMLWFYAMARVPIAEVTALGYTAPIFVTLGAAYFFGEKLHVRRIMAVVIGFVGAMIILRPGFQEISSGQLAQLTAAPLFAASFLLAKALTREFSAVQIVAMLSLFCTCMLLPGALLQWRDPTLEEVLWLSLVAAFATAGHYALTRAFAAAPLTVTQPVGFLQLVWAAALGILVFGEALDPFVFLGGGIVVAAVSYISHREAVAARRMRTPPEVATKT